MVFEHVKMGPVEAAFLAWKEANDAAVQAEGWIGSFLVNRAHNPGLRLFVNLSLGACTDSGTSSTNRDAEGVRDKLEANLREDLEGNVRAAIAAMRADAEQKRVALLRLTMSAIAGEETPAADDAF